MGKLRVKQFWGVAMVFLSCLAFLLVTSGAQAANVNFSQSILPVRFVYLNDQREITRIWSNVAENDNFYVIKYFDEASSRETNVSEDKIFPAYCDIINKSQLVSGSVVAWSARGNSRQNNLEISFVRTSGNLEEIHTYA